MHYFSPVHKMPLLEVIRTDKTSPEVVATAVAVGKKQGKTVIVVNDGVGFYTTRVLAPYLNEACWLLMEGLSVEAIDQALVDWGWPVVRSRCSTRSASTSPRTWGASCTRRSARGSTRRRWWPRRSPTAARGARTKRGSICTAKPRRKKGKGKHVDPTIYAALGLRKPVDRARGARRRHPDALLAAVRQRGAALPGEGILSSARDGDVGAVFGLGFPPFRGGPFRLVDELGASEVLRRMRTYEQALGQRWTPAPVLVEMASTNRRFFG